MLLANPKLREILVLRRKVHKLFDMLKCSKWQSIIEKNGYPKHLVLKDAYLTPS